MCPKASALETALRGLSTRRLARLAACLESTSDLKLSVGSWWPQCPMVLAGFDPRQASPVAPEHYFAAVWDHVAVGKPRWRWIALPGGPLVARQCDVQLLLRTVNAVLAARHAHARARGNARRLRRDPTRMPSSSPPRPRPSLATTISPCKLRAGEAAGCGRSMMLAER